MAELIKSRGHRKNFFMCSNAVFELNLSPFDLSVYICLMRYSNHAGTAFPGYTRIAKNCSMSRRKAIMCVQSLIDRGLVEKESRTDEAGRCTSNLYIVIEPESVGVDNEEVPEEVISDVELRKTLDLLRKKLKA